MSGNPGSSHGEGYEVQPEMIAERAGAVKGPRKGGGKGGGIGGKGGEHDVTGGETDEQRAERAERERAERERKRRKTLI